ncbi:hypothetical protein ACFL2R_01305 [Patescibacteria group bacterium]
MKSAKMIVVLAGILMFITATASAEQHLLIVNPLGCVSGLDVPVEDAFKSCGIMGIPDPDDPDEFRYYMRIDENIPSIRVEKNPHLYMVSNVYGVSPADNFYFDNFGNLFVFVGNGDNGVVFLDEETHYILSLDDDDSGEVIYRPLRRECVSAEGVEGETSCEDDLSRLVPVNIRAQDHNDKIVHFTIDDEGTRHYSNR